MPLPNLPHRLSFLASLALCTAAGHALAQAADPAPAAAPAVAPAAMATPVALTPFVASYQAYNAGNLAGTAVMRVVKRSGDLWRVDMDVKADAGLAGLAGLTLQQSTAFRSEDGLDLVPLGQSTVRSAVFSKKQSTGVYDWKNHLARWNGDVKESRKAPVPLQEGDLSTLLLNLAVIRDAQPGRNLSYRLVDDGRARAQTYAVAAQPEIIAVGDLSYDALRVTRTGGSGNETTLWVAAGVPTPVRILQREDGQDKLDLRLVQYQDASP